MAEKAYQIRKCIRPECGYRFPVLLEHAGRSPCPKCRANTFPADEPFGSLPVEDFGSRPPDTHLEVVLDNIRSTFNVGSMFRSADAAGVQHIHLCGISPTPLNTKIGKTALGAEQAVAWTHHKDGLSAVMNLREAGYRLWALEGGPASQSIFHSVDDLDERPLVLVVGNEVSGIDPGILDACEKVVAIPMLGGKESLNVAIAFGIAVYTLRFRLKTHQVINSV